MMLIAFNSKEEVGKSLNFLNNNDHRQLFISTGSEILISRKIAWEQEHIHVPAPGMEIYTGFPAGGH